MADINLDGVIENAEQLNEELEITKEVLDDIKSSKEDILAISEQQHHREIEVNKTLKKQSSELDTQDTSIGVIVDDLDKELSKLQDILRTYEDISNKINNIKNSLSDISTPNVTLVDNQRSVNIEIYNLLSKQISYVSSIKNSVERLGDRLLYIKDEISNLYARVRGSSSSSNDNNINDAITSLKDNLSYISGKLDQITSLLNKGGSNNDNNVEPNDINTSLAQIISILNSISKNTMVGGANSSNNTQNQNNDDEDGDGGRVNARGKKNGFFAQTLVKTLDIMVNALKEGANKWVEIDQKVVEFGRHAGLAANQIRAVQKNVLENYGQMAARLGMTYEEIFKFQEQYVQNTGRAILLTNDQVESLATMSKLVGDTAVDTAVQNMDDLGASTSTASEYLALTMARARAQGLDATKASEAFATNIKMASRYTFRDGVNGISRMTMLSQQLKFNMESIGSTIEKFSTIEGAIETSANIQMLGGAYASNFANPLEAMGEALMDAEGFINRIVNTVSSQAVFNKQTGQVEMAAFEKARLREFAKQMGINYDEAWNMVAQQTKIQSIGREVGLDKYSEADQALIANKAQFNAEKGQWEITMPGNTEGTAISALTDGMLSQLRDSSVPQEAIQKDVHDIRGALNRYVTYTMTDSRSLKEAVKGAQENWAMTKANASDFLMNPVKGGALSLTKNGGKLGSFALAGGLTALGTIATLGQGKINDIITNSVSSTSNIPTRGTSGAGGGGGANGSWTRYLGRNAPRGVKIGGGALSAAYGAYTIINSSSNYRESLRDIERNNQLTESEKIEARYDAKLGRNKDIGAGIGSVVGGIAGSFLGPVGTLVGGAIGSAAGKWIGDIVTKDDRSLINNSQVSYNHNYSQMGINNASQVGYVNNNGVQSIPTVGNSQYIKETATNTFASNNKLSIEPLSLNVNGTIKLTSDKLSSCKIDAEALFKDPKVESMIKAIVVDAIQKGAIQPKVNRNSTQAQLGGTVSSPKEQDWR